MPPKKTKVAVLFNEAHPEFYTKKIDLNSENLSFTPFFEANDLTPMEEYEIFAERIRSKGFECYTMNVLDNLSSLMRNLQTETPDVIFNFVEIYKENSRWEVHIAGLYELLGFAYTGAPPQALANAQSKILTKNILKSFGVNTPDSALFSVIQTKYEHKLNYPLIVKPAFEDASVGIENKSVVFNYDELKERIEFVIDYFKQPALVEEFIEGRELNVAIFGDDELEVLPISEIDFSEMPKNLANIVSYQAKWDPLHEAYHKTIPRCPAELNEEVQKIIEETALSAFKALRVRDYARVDMRLAKDNQIFVLEVNPNPDLTEGAGFMRSAEAAGYQYDDMLVKIIDLALKRKK